jgi:hypothetical protein
MRVSGVELLHQPWGVPEVGGRFPRVVLSGVSFPMDQVLDAASSTTGVPDGFGLVLDLVVIV